MICPNTQTIFKIIPKVPTSIPVKELRDALNASHAPTPTFAFSVKAKPMPKKWQAEPNKTYVDEWCWMS